MRDYSAIPYRKGGLDETGVDCWGLVRMAYLDELGIELPAFPEQDGDGDAMADRLAMERERWRTVTDPQPMDVVVMRVEGMPKHVAVYIGDGMMTHALKSAGVVTERIDSPRWRDRIEGFCRYDGGAVTLSGCPHPLRTTRIDSVTVAGLSLEKMIHHAMIYAGWTHPERVRGAAWVDGVPVPRAAWAETMPLAGSRVEFRLVPGSGSTARLVGMLAVVGLSIAAASFTAGLSLFANGGTLLGLGGAAWGGIAGAAVSMAGSLLVNAIFPVRPALARNPGTAESQNLLSGAQNSATKYGAVPVVLGRYRFSAPLAANTYAETNATTSFLRLALCWGYGPLQVSDIRIGDTSIASLENCEIQTLTGSSSDTSAAKTQFNKIYGRDVTQQQVGVGLPCTYFDSVTWTRASNVMTVVTSTAHGFSTGYAVRIGSVASGSITVVNATTFTLSSVGPNGTGTTWADGSAWVERVLTDEADQVQVTLHFPEGLREMAVEGGNAGRVGALAFVGAIQVRQLDSDTLVPITAWGDVQRTVPTATIALSPAEYQLDSDTELESVYQWTRISVDEHGKIISRTGAVTTSKLSNPSGALLARLQADVYGVGVTFSRLPNLGSGEEHLYDICVYGSTVNDVQDKRDASITGCALTQSGLDITIASGSATRADIETVRLGAEGQAFCKWKDAFSHNVTFNVPRGRHEVRVRRANDSKSTVYYESGNEGRRYGSCTYLAVTGYKSSKPITPPKPMALTAIRVKATDQLSGNLEAITGTCTSICLDYDRTTGAWVSRGTRNPASLYRYVLQHPANARRCADSQIDLTALATWHDYCRTNGFMFDSVVTSQQSLMDVLRDICAAGRSTPHYADGRWTVCTDKARTSISQCFTPHNSWGFEGVRSFPDVPHAFRVTFANSLRGYQDDEMLVYDDGYSSSNATLIEALQLPGVTTPTAIHKHARFHLAQLHLRPETYALNCDFEHLICTKGDLVRVTHDVPMWGVGTGRIKTWVNSTTLVLDNDMPMDGGVRYTIRIRRSDTGATLTRNVAAKPTDGYYTTITLESAVTETEGAPGNLFLFGALSAESVECIVQSIEPGENHSARLTLVDYSPAVYGSDTEVIPDFDSQITSAPNITIRGISAKPTIGQISSDERAMSVSATGALQFNMRVGWTNPKNMPSSVVGIEGQIDTVGGGDAWVGAGAVPLSSGIVFSDVELGASYRIRLRYVTTDGRTGPWSDIVTHAVTGRVIPPRTVASVTARRRGVAIVLAAPEADIPPDFARYEFRVVQGMSTGDAWAEETYVVRYSTDGAATIPLAEFGTPRMSVAGIPYRVAVRMVDTSGNVSVSSASATVTIKLPR